MSGLPAPTSFPAAHVRPTASAPRREGRLDRHGAGSVAAAQATTRTDHLRLAAHLAADLRPGTGAASSIGRDDVEVLFEAAWVALTGEPWISPRVAARLIPAAVDGAGPARPSDEALRARFGLTRQETRVARLLAARRTNAEIAATLPISPSTARRHTEQVLAKLNVASRTDVEARLAEAETRGSRGAAPAASRAHAPPLPDRPAHPSP